MEFILTGEGTTGNELLNAVLFCLAGLRIYLEIVGAPLAELPVSRMVFGERAKAFHRTGLFLAIGHVVLFAPTVLLGY